MRNLANKCLFGIVYIASFLLTAEELEDTLIWNIGVQISLF